MYRKIMGFLKEWKESEHRKPLILQGARQVGKTYSILEFGRTDYENVAYFNFETNPKLSDTFEENISPDYLIPILSHIAGQTIVKEKTLIVFDEVQLCERALTSLKYFCEDAPDYHIIVAGSLLGVSTLVSILAWVLPIIIFVVAVFLAFATGTSWGTFSILVPIVCHAFPDGEMLVVSIAACLSGAVCGDHCSPISDTTIMASAGAHCSHVNHVSTQLPYAMTAAAISAGCYLLCGAAQAVLGDAANTLTSFVLLACAIVIELVVLSIVRARMGHTGKEEVTKS